MKNGTLMAVTSRWEVTVSPAVDSNAAWRSELLARVRARLERSRMAAPGQREFTYDHPLLQVRVRHVEGPVTGGELQLRVASIRTASDTSVDGSRVDLPNWCLPDPDLHALGERLVGLDAIRADMLVRLQCHWQDRLQRWADTASCPLPAAVSTVFAGTTPLFILTGDPGTGKSALARATADGYCRETGEEGRLLLLGTQARGDGLVGDIGKHLRMALRTARDAARSGPCFVVIDEGDALAVRRSERHAHHEDRAGTATLLQELDALAGQRVAVFLSTNLLDSLDAAVLRRGTTYHFPRPDGRARRQLLQTWCPGASASLLGRAVGRAAGLTPWDIERALSHAYLQAIREERPLTEQDLLAGLRRAQRTERV